MVHIFKLRHSYISTKRNCKEYMATAMPKIQMGYWSREWKKDIKERTNGDTDYGSLLWQLHNNSFL